MDSNINNEEVKRFKVLLAYLKQLAKDGVTPLIEKQLLLLLDNLIPFFSHFILTKEFYEIKRVTINKRVVGSNKRITEIKHLKYPPAELVEKYGRCNFPKESVLYASFFDLTILNELKPDVGDLVTFSTWRTKSENDTLKLCPIFKNQPTKKDLLNPRTFEIEQLYKKELKKHPEELIPIIDELIQFIADAFTKRVHKHNHLNYIFSAYFSRKIFNEFESGSIDAIYYPSVQDGLTFENLAIKPSSFDKKYELIEVADDFITMSPMSGGMGYFMEGLGDCKSFDLASGKILWDKNQIRQSKERLLELKKDFGVELD